MQNRVQFPIPKVKAIELLENSLPQWTPEDGDAIAKDEVVDSLMAGFNVQVLRNHMQGRGVRSAVQALIATSMQLGYALAIDQMAAERLEKSIGL